MNDCISEEHFAHQPSFFGGVVDLILWLSRLECCLEINFKIPYIFTRQSGGIVQ